MSQSTMQLTEYEVAEGREIWKVILIASCNLLFLPFLPLGQRKYKITAWPAHSIIQTTKKRVSSELLLPF